MCLVVWILILVWHVFHRMVSICSLIHWAILNAHERAKTSHGSHGANDRLIIKYLLIILVVLHHLIAILSPGVARRYPSNILADRHIEILLFLVDLRLLSRWSLSLVCNLASLGQIGHRLNDLGRVGRVEPPLVVLEGLLLLLLLPVGKTLLVVVVEDVFCGVTFVVLTDLVVDGGAEDVIAHRKVFGLAVFVHVRLWGSYCFLNLNHFIFVGRIRHTEWLLLLLVWVPHGVEAMGGAELTLVTLAVSGRVLPSGVRVCFALYFYEVGRLDQRVGRLLPVLGLRLSSVVIWEVGRWLSRDLLICVVSGNWGLRLVYVLSALLRLLGWLFTWLFAQELLTTKSIALHQHCLLLALNGWRAHHLASLAFQVVWVVLHSLLVICSRLSRRRTISLLGSSDATLGPRGDNSAAWLLF